MSCTESFVYTLTSEFFSINNLSRKCPLLGCTVSVRHPLDGVSMLREEHDGHTWNLADTPLEVSIARPDDVAFVLFIGEGYKVSY